MFPRPRSDIGFRPSSAPGPSRSVERGTAGNPVALMTTGGLVTRYGWPSAFYVFGGMGVLWAVVWFALIPNHPDADLKMSEAERVLLREAMQQFPREDGGALGCLALAAGGLGARFQ